MTESVEMKKCPNCGMLNKSESNRCYCGFQFSSVQLRNDSSAPDMAPKPFVERSVPNVRVSNPRGADVVLVDIDIPFLSMVKFMVKWAFASIPAMIIVFMIWILAFAAFGSIATLFGLLGAGMTGAHR